MGRLHLFNTRRDNVTSAIRSSYELIVNSGNLSEIPDQTALMHGPGFFTIELPEDDDGNAIPLDASVEDTTFLDELYDSYLPVCQLIEHFVVHQHGPSVIKKWMKNHPWEPLIHMFSAPDIVYTLFLLENYGHDQRRSFEQ